MEMKFKSICFIIFIAISSCNNESKNKEHQSLSSDSKIIDSISKIEETVLDGDILRDSIWNNKEYLDFTKVKINGKLPLITDTLSLYNLIGKPDQVVIPNMDDVCISFYDKDFKEANYKTTNFELYGDTIVLSSMNFKDSPNLYLKIGNLILNHQTTLKDIEKTYPKAVKFKGQMDVHQLGNLTTIYLQIGQNSLSDSSWILFFDKERLIRIDHSIPC
jgi:hypothetical protein